MIEWTESALEQLDQVYDYIVLRADNEVAERIGRRILNNVHQLTMFPMSGRVGRVNGTRELVIADTPFIAAYTIHAGSIVILALYHGAHQWPEEF